MALVLTRSDSLLPSIVSDFFDGDLLTTSQSVDWDEIRRRLPPVNVIENNNNMVIEIAAPGLKKQDFKLEVDNGVLTISSEQNKEETKNYNRKEFSYGTFSRSFNLPENILSEKITAEYEDGILTLTLPKQEVTVSLPKKQIKIF